MKERQPFSTNPTKDWYLVSDAQKGNEGAFASLYEKYQLPVFLYARKHIGHFQDAEDIAQNVFIKVWTHIDRYKPIAPFSSWLFRIAHNEVVDHQKQYTRRGEQDLGKFFTFEAHELTPEEVLELKEFNDYVALGLHAIPEKDREPILLHVLDGLPWKEVEKRVGMTANMWKTRASRDMKRAKAVLEKEIV